MTTALNTYRFHIKLLNTLIHSWQFSAAQLQQVEAEDASNVPSTSASQPAVRRGRGRGRRATERRARGRGATRRATTEGSSLSRSNISQRRPIARPTGVFGRHVNTHIVERRGERLQELRVSHWESYVNKESYTCLNVPCGSYSCRCSCALLLIVSETIQPIRAHVTSGWRRCKQWQGQGGGGWACTRPLKWHPKLRTQGMYTVFRENKRFLILHSTLLKKGYL